MTTTNSHDQLPLFLEPTAPDAGVEKASSLSSQNRDHLLIATWNVNSIRTRLGLVTDWLRSITPDVLCLQETRVADNAFPHAAFGEIGYKVITNGEASRNGVAIVSRHPMRDVERGLGDLEESETRAIAATIEGMRIVNVYVPNAHSTTDPRFPFKVMWLKRLARYLASVRRQHSEVLLCGDFNVTPRESDVHDSSLWLYRTFVNPEVRKALSEVVAQGVIDLHLLLNPDQIAYTWWDYRQDAFSRGNGLRIDHIYATERTAKRCIQVHTHTGPRAAEKPSDHAPVLATLLKAGPVGEQQGLQEHPR
jgi:exodeoxyribonuclease III